MESYSLGYKDFDIVKDLGSGSFGKVQLARKKTDQQLYAIKSVNMVRLTKKQKESALNEVRLLASINIPYVIQYKGSFYDGQNQSLCLVMQYADGGDLQQKMNEQYKHNNGEGFAQNFIWKVAFQLFQGLKILHESKIIHRDIKSANIFFVNDIAKFGDLNVSKVIEGNGMCSTHTGTPYYTSPQIWKGKQYGRKCDIWSTGCLLYEMCTLHPPFRAQDFPSLFRKVIVGNYTPIPSHYSQQLSQIIRLCLTVDENLRPEASFILQTPILSGMQLHLQKFRESVTNIKLIDPIKCPKVLKFLNKRLPQSKFEIKAKKTVGFISKKQIQFVEKQQNQYQRSGNSLPRASKKVKSQKIIILENTQQDDQHHNKLPLITHSKNNIKLPPLQKQPQQSLKFSNKKMRVPFPLQKKILPNIKKHSIVIKNKVARITNIQNNSNEII